MSAMPGAMGMAVASFVGMWTVMMAAMMLPSVVGFVSMYERTVVDRRAWRLTALAGGYLLVWGMSGVAAFVIVDAFGYIAAQDRMLAQGTAIAVFAAAGAYQLSPLKFRCLSHCRSPLGHLVHYLGFQGRLRDLRAGIAHGWFCLGCCWALMLLMAALGVMNLAAMFGLSAVIAVEKMWRHGERFARVVGWAAIGYAAALVFAPELAPGLYAAPGMAGMGP